MSKPNKYRNIVAEIRKERFTSVTLNDKITEGSYIAVNSSFLALGNFSLGHVAIVDPNIPRSCCGLPVIEAHKLPINDMKFSPFRSDLLATVSEDTTVKLWKIPEGGLSLTETYNRETQQFLGHKKKPLFVNFNPIAEDVIVSTDIGSVQVWNVQNSETISSIELKNWPTSCQWNRNGSLIGLTDKGKEINIFDPRQSKMAITTPGFQSPKIQKMNWIDNEVFIVAGFGKNNDREIALYDIRKVNPEGKLGNPVFGVKIDHQSGTLTPYIDPESKIIYLNARGEGSFYVYDIEPDKLNKLTTLYNDSQSLSLAMLERRALDYGKNEIDRFLKFTPKKEIEIVSIVLPRRVPGFDATLYPPVFCGEPSLNVEQWSKGENGEPKVKEINTIENKYVTKVDAFIKKEAPKKVADTPEEKIKELEKKINELTSKLEAANKTIEKLTKENTELKNQSNAGNTAPTTENKTAEPEKPTTEAQPETKTEAPAEAPAS